jgi:hypothetical protein
MEARDIPQKNVGDRWRAAEANALINAHKASAWQGEGFGDELSNLSAPRIQSKDKPLQFYTASAIPAYSVFSLVAGQAWHEPVRFEAKKIGIINPGSHFAFFTNGSLAASAGSYGWANPINDYAPSRVAYSSSGPTPQVGLPCGPRFEEWEIDGERYGLTCVAVNASTLMAEVVRSRDVSGIVGKVYTKITAFDPDTNTLGVGQISVGFRTVTTNVLADAKDPSTSSVPLLATVYNLNSSPVDVNSIVRVQYALGVGLVVVSNAGVLVPIEIDTTLERYGEAQAYILDDDGLKTTDEVTVYDILGFYEGEQGDRGWVIELSDGKLKLVSLSCDPPEEQETVATSASAAISGAMASDASIPSQTVQGSTAPTLDAFTFPPVQP